MIDVTKELSKIAIIIATPSIQDVSLWSVSQFVPTSTEIDTTADTIRIFNVKSSNAPKRILKNPLSSAYGGILDPYVYILSSKSAYSPFIPYLEST